MRLTKNCMECGKQIPATSSLNICDDCLFAKPKANCSFCKTTDCPAWGSAYFKSIDKRIYVDFRADMEFNQIDCQFGLLDENGMSDEATWSDFAIDINYCPVCGRKLPPVE